VGGRTSIREAIGATAQYPHRPTRLDRFRPWREGWDGACARGRIPGYDVGLDYHGADRGVQIFAHDTGSLVRIVDRAGRERVMRP